MLKLFLRMLEENMKNWTNEKLEMEISFARAALDESMPESVEWLRKLEEEQRLRQLDNGNA